MGAYDNCIILIPALQPDERLIQMIHGLHERGFHKIAVTDDGSSDDRQKYFQEVEIMGVKVIHHSKNEYSTHSEPHRPALRATYSII